MIQRLSNAAMLLGLGFVAAQTCLYTVDPGEKALIMDSMRGLSQKVIGQGLHPYIPFIQKPIIYDCRMRPIDINVQTGTKDLQTVTISLRVLHHPITEFLPQIHQLLGREYDKKIFFSIGQEVLRTVVAQCTAFIKADDADQLLKFREEISKEIKSTLTQKAKEFNVAVEDVSFMHLGFSREYSQAIEQKAVQQQLAERQKSIVARDEELKLAQIIRSEAEAESASLINNAVKKFGSAQIEIKRLEAAKIIAEELASNPNISFVPDGTNNLLNLRV